MASVKEAIFVPRTGIEPAHLAAADFESAASTNSATWALPQIGWQYYSFPANCWRIRSKYFFL